MTLKGALKFSLAIHLLAFFLIGGFPKGCVPFGGGEGDSQTEAETQAKNENKPDKEEILEKPEDQPTEITLIEETAEQAEKRVERSIRKAISECEPFFGGLGIEYASDTGIISKVYKYYPGYDAGLRKGDQIISPAIHDIRGDIGTIVRIQYIRNGEAYAVDATRGRICTSIRQEAP